MRAFGGAMLAMTLATGACGWQARSAGSSGAAGQARLASAGRPTVYLNGRWLTDTGFVERPMYAVNGVFTDHEPARPYATINLRGGYVIPPFGDAHTHNLDGPSNLDSVRARYLREGTFYVQVLTNTRSGAGLVRQRFNWPCDLDVRYANGGLTSTLSHPFLAYEPRGMGLYDPTRWRARATEIRRSRVRDGDAYWFMDSLPDLERQWPRILDGRPDLIKIFLLDASEHPLAQPDTGLPSGQGLRPSLVPVIVRRAHAAGLCVAAHVETAGDFRVALEAGVDLFAHLPGYEMPAGADPSRYEIDDSTVRLAGRRGAVATPTLSLAGVFGLEGGSAELVAARRRVQLSNIRRLLAAGAHVAVGSDWFARTAAIEFDTLAATGIWSPRELLRLWGAETSLAIFPGRRIGRLEPGYEASYLVLRSDPLRAIRAVHDIRLRVKQGCIVGE